MKTTSNNNNIESKNGMSQVIIDMSPKTIMYEGHGRETLTEVYYRVNVTAYTANLYTYTEQAREESKKACEAYYSEVVALLQTEGWERQNDKYDDCPTMKKGTQQLRCHPQEIVGNVLGEDVERLAEKLKGMTSCKWIGVDVYSNCVITTSAEDTMQLYRQTWDCEIMDIMAEMFRTKRTTMYYKLEARLHNVADRIRIKINDWRNGKVDYEHDEDVRDFDSVRLGGDYVVNVYLREWARRAISEGRLIVAKNADGVKIARWVNKKEEKERAKAIREAEKAEKERKATTLQPASEIKDDSFFIKGKKYRCIKSVKGNFTKGKVYKQASEPTAWCGWLINDGGESHGWPQPANIAKACEVWDLKPEDADPRNYFEPVEDVKEAENVKEAEGVKVGDKVRHNKHEEVATVTAIREAFVNGCDGYRYLYTLDFGQSVKGPFDVELNGGEFLREAFTVCKAA